MKSVFLSAYQEMACKTWSPSATSSPGVLRIARTDETENVKRKLLRDLELDTVAAAYYGQAVAGSGEIPAYPQPVAAGRQIGR